ncbi:HORMA domain-containing protein 2-like protein [Dinothrombium tinctorium]|uniref:HORMA domain-containing protein 2-like protein n=1 Tax=Dinothrombium tinctorium TaxID=1965070 RepID=A0A3S3PRD1_9ACAR|nr:HORMA domain-containing protein 2-like protein [Dinothrombium tinctorium]
MSLTSQRIEEKSKSETFFAQEVKSECESLLHMKKLTAIAFSTVLYLREVFDESAYGERKHENFVFRILSERSDCKEATQIVRLIKGAFDALEKKYLREIIFGFYTDLKKPNDLIEAYSFKYSYNDGGKHFNLTFNNFELNSSSRKLSLNLQTEKSLKQLLTFARSLSSLPSECYLTMKLRYYDDVTPKEYEPPGFKSCVAENFRINGKRLNVTTGLVETDFHSLQMKVNIDQTTIFPSKHQLESEEQSTTSESEQNNSKNFSPLKKMKSTNEIKKEYNLN